MKKLLLTLFFCLFTATCFGADLLKVSNKQVYKTTLGIENDEVIIGKETDTTTFTPQITFTRWNKENSLILKLPSDLISNTTPTLAGKQLTIGDSKTGFYFAPQDDNEKFKFGLILNQTPKNTDTWSFEIQDGGEFDYFYQPLLKNLNEDGSTWEDNGHGGIINRDADHSGGWVIYHKWKANYETGKINYGTGKAGVFSKPRLLDADNKFLGYVDLLIKDGSYKLSIANIPQSVLDNAKLPLKFNDQYGKNTVGGTNDYGFNNYIIANSYVASAGQITKAYFATKCATAPHNVRMALYVNTTKPTTLIANTDSGSMAISRTTAPTSDLATWTQADITSGFTLVATTTYWILACLGNDDIYIYYDTVAGQKQITGNYATFPDATVDPDMNDYPNRISMCYEYTAGGGAVDAATIMIVN